MDKIIGLGNALVDVLATLEDDTLLGELNKITDNKITTTYKSRS